MHYSILWTKCTILGRIHNRNCYRNTIYQFIRKIINIPVKIIPYADKTVTVGFVKKYVTKRQAALFNPALYILHLLCFSTPLRLFVSAIIIQRNVETINVQFKYKLYKTNLLPQTRKCACGKPWDVRYLSMTTMV